MATTTDSNTTITVNPPAASVPPPQDFRTPKQPVSPPAGEAPVAATQGNNPTSGETPASPPPAHTINIHSPAANVPPPPDFGAFKRPETPPETEAPVAAHPTHETPAGEMHDAKRHVHATTAGPRVDRYRHAPEPGRTAPLGTVNNVEITEKPGKVDTHTHHQPNWGRIVKGAMVVAAVVLVAVVAIAVVPPLVTGAINALGLGPLLSSVYATVGPALTAAADIALSGFAFVSAFLSSTLTAVGTAIGFTGGTAAAGAAAATATGQAAGYVVAGGALAAGAPLAAKALMSQPLVDPVQHTIETPAETTITGVEDGGSTNTHATHAAANSKATATSSALSSHATQTAGQNNPLTDLPDIHEDMLQHQQSSNMKHASKIAHHASEPPHEHDADLDTADSEPEPDTERQPKRARQALTNTARANGEWASKVGARVTNRDRAALARHESRTSQVEADRAALADSVIR